MSDLFEHYSRAAREAYAKTFLFPVEVLDGDDLTIVDRPEHMTWSTVIATTFGTGTVLSIDPEYRAFIEANRPEKHFRAMSGTFLRSIAEEGERRGVKLLWHTPGLCFVLATGPQELPLPAGFQMREHDSEWMRAEQPNRRFENAVGEVGEAGRDVRNRFALALYDDRDELLAVAGASDLNGMVEIGVDVAPEYRGQGLGRLVVTATAREIMRRGEVPFYACAPTNIRSQRTAASCGFRVVCSDAFVSSPV